jgi:transposase InsO family protein
VQTPNWELRVCVPKTSSAVARLETPAVLAGHRTAAADPEKLRRLLQQRQDAPVAGQRYALLPSGSPCREPCVIGYSRRPSSPICSDLNFRYRQLLILKHGRREIIYLSATAHPSAEWISRQLTEAYGWEEAPCYLVHDRDSAYGEVFIRRLWAMGIRDRPTAPRSLWQNCYCERLIGSIRWECLDHILVFGVRHLRRLLRAYADYYNHTRTHLSLDKDSPASRAIEPFGRVCSVPILGGLHHRYVRI